MKGPDHEKSLLGRVPPGTLASSSERFTKSRARQLHTWPNQPAVKAPMAKYLCKAPQLRPSYYSSPGCCFSMGNVDQISDFEAKKQSGHTS
ncbi:MAG: hypothetical protein KTR25_05045 [Myxococcales bacterium]|nr:hypothetical protein [Myxococcales bacterium]